MKLIERIVILNVEMKKKKDDVIEMFHFSHQDIHLFTVAASITYQKAIRLELLSGINAMIRECAEHISIKNNIPLAKKNAVCYNL